MAEPMLSIEGLQASYGRAQALFDISMRIGPGEVVTLLGRNGMGRSTTLKCLFGLLPVRAGSIRLRGQRIDGQPSHRIARDGLALVPEGRQVFPSLRVDENLVATARPPRPGNGLRPWDLQRVYALFPRLQERSANLGSQLSGGEQQMLAIGRALMTNPQILVLDEATEGLAPVVRQEIWRALAQLKSEGLALVVVDKHLSALLPLADRHYLVDKGRTVWQGSSAELRAAPELVSRHLGM